MISINSVYTAVQAILNKENRGYLRPEEFNNFASVALYDVINDIKDAQKMVTTSIIKGKSNRIDSAYVDEAMDKFYTPATLTLSGGQYDKPVDFDVLESMYYGDTQITKASVREAKLMQTISYMNPSDHNPVYIEYNDKYEVVASDAIDEIEIYYYRKPKTPKWTYTTIGQDIVYDGSNAGKQDFELPIAFFNDLTIAILKYAGLHIRDDKIIQAILKEKQISDISEYRDQILNR